ncbi:MAG: hypothetical protein AAGK97_06350 [Bacteroidota bacterium]
MKTIIKIFFLVFIIPLQMDAQRNANPFYVQVGGGKDVYVQSQQVGFNNTGTANHVYAEFGTSKGVLRPGIFYTWNEKQSFFTYTMESQTQGVYLKLNLSPYIRFIPYGIDPYISGTFGMEKNKFTNLTDDSEGNPQIEVSNTMRASNTFHAGVDIGRKLFILSFQYTYKPGSVTFQRQDVDALQLYNGKHAFDVRLGIRLSPNKNNRTRCPKFGRRSKGNTSF